MLPIECIRCHRPYFSASRPRPGVRCIVCRGRLEVARGEGAGALTALPLEIPTMVRAEPGSYEEGELTFASIIEFVNDDPRRGPSRERDVGLTWRGQDERTFRAAWIRDTGELYLVQTGSAAIGGGHVELLGSAPDSETLLQRLAGWESRCGNAHSVEWLRTRAGERLDPTARRIATTVDVRRIARRLSAGSQHRPSVLTPLAPRIG